MKNYFLLLGVCILLGSCSTPETPTTAQPQQGGSSSALLYLNCRAVSQDEIEFVFSQPVTIKYLNFEPKLEIASMEDGSTVKVKLKEKVELGILITADLLAEDDKKNTISVTDSFRTRNDRIPKLVINELCTENGTSTNKRTEFIELKMKSDGNLGAIRLFILGNTSVTKETIYEFLPCEVKKNQYVTLHLRTLEESCKDEYGGNISESGGANSSETAWDFWIPGDKKLMQTAATTVYLLDQDNNVLDAVMISENPDSWWAKDYFAEAAAFLFNSGAWKSPDGVICSPADAVASGKTTNTRTICRDETVENTKTSADWYITDTSNASPGKQNSIKRYLK